jgi:hypothetical protein
MSIEIREDIMKQIDVTRTPVERFFDIGTILCVIMVAIPLGEMIYREVLPVVIVFLHLNLQ